MAPRRYRSALMIIQLILEELIKIEKEGLVKSQLYKNIGLKTVVGEKYLEQLLGAEYVTVTEELWGKERYIHKVRITHKGIQRFQWFIRLSSELNI
jgi:predicted transcriptional regulator